MDADGAGRANADAPLDRALPAPPARGARPRGTHPESGRPPLVPRAADPLGPRAPRGGAATLPRARGGGRGRDRLPTRRSAARRPGRPARRACGRTRAARLTLDLPSRVVEAT